MNTSKQSKSKKSTSTKISATEIKSIQAWDTINKSLVEQFTTTHKQGLQQPLNKYKVNNRLLTTIHQLKQTISNNQQVISNTTAQLTKADICWTIFQEEYARMNGQLDRKFIIDRFMKETNLSKAGAGTYYQNMRQKANLVATK